MESIDKWFSKEVLQWRAGASVVWSVITVPVFSVLYLFLSYCQPFHPLEWFTGFVSNGLSLTCLSTVLVVMVINTVFYLYSRNTFTVVPSISITRFSQLPQLFKGTVLVYSILCLSCGLMLGWLGTCLLGGRYSGLSTPCTHDSPEYCINEYHLFLVLYGGYAGFMYVIFHYVRHNNVLQFPTLQQAKFFRVRGSLMKVAWTSLGYVIWQIKFFYLFYYLFGGFLRDGIADTVSLGFKTEARLDSIYNLLVDVALLWQALLVGLLIQVSWSYGALLYKVYNTEYFEFPISTMFENFKNKCLVDAMSCTTMPLLQALGFLDLNILSKQSYTRRKELFSLSQPGGHPHNWNKILSVCLSVIQELNDTVQEVNWKILASAPVRQPNLEKSASNGHSNGVKQRSSSSDETSKTTVKDKVLTGLKKRSMLKFFTREIPETANKNLFSSAYIQVWAVEALSALVVASYNEDSFGVVQMSLRDIITAIINLQENIDKHFKLTGGISRRLPKDSSGSEVPVKYLLHSTLKNSIYSMVNAFGKHLLDVGLTVEVEKRLQHFLNYKE